MTILKNFWVQKRYKTVCDGEWMLFLWGLTATSMLQALETASRKSHTALKISEESSTRWTAVDLESDTHYIVEMRDDKPAIEDSKNMSVRDQTIPVREERKPMPIPRSLFKEKQLPLF